MWNRSHFVYLYDLPACLPLIQEGHRLSTFTNGKFIDEDILHKLYLLFPKLTHKIPPVQIKMTYQPTEAELAAHTFEYDSATLDKPLADFIQKFYTLSDDRENADSWAACFTDDATMKRKLDDVVGREGNSPLCRPSCD